MLVALANTGRKANGPRVADVIPCEKELVRWSHASPETEPATGLQSELSFELHVQKVSPGLEPHACSTASVDNFPKACPEKFVVFPAMT